MIDLHPVNTLRRRSLATLLCLLVTAVFVIPVVTPYGDVWPLVRDVVITTILLAGYLAVANRRAYSRLLAAVVAIAITAKWVAHVVPSSMLPAVDGVSLFVSLTFIAVLVGMRTFGPGRVTIDRLLGAITLYLLLGMIWAATYDLIALVVPDAFGGSLKEGPGLEHWFYFSFATLTTTGYGDVVPVAHVAQSLAMLEALVGQLYPAVVIARLVSLPIGGNDRRTASGGTEK